MEGLSHDKIIQYIEEAKQMLHFEAITKIHLQPIYHYEHGRTYFNCPALFHKLLLSLNETVTWPPPEQIPISLKNAYTLQGLIPSATWYFAKRQATNIVDWPIELFDFYADKLSCGYYTTLACNIILDKYASQYVTNKTGLILGSEHPWAESKLLNRYFAKKIITVEYSEIITTYPNIQTMLPHQMAEQYLEGNFPSIDFIFSFSSIEHDGLGRYGDILHPFADLETLSRMYCLLPSGGILFLGVPSGSDAIVWNAHRVYGKYRLALLLQDWWEIVDSFNTQLFSRGFGQEGLVNNSIGWEEALYVLRKR
jgi:hypothetical protein